MSFMYPWIKEHRNTPVQRADVANAANEEESVFGLTGNVWTLPSAKGEGQIERWCWCFGKAAASEILQGVPADDAIADVLQGGDDLRAAGVTGVAAAAAANENHHAEVLRDGAVNGQDRDGPPVQAMSRRTHRQCPGEPAREPHGR